jgi:hypothetical protein
MLLQPVSEASFLLLQQLEAILGNTARPATARTAATRTAANRRAGGTELGGLAFAEDPASQATTDFIFWSDFHFKKF